MYVAGSMCPGWFCLDIALDALEVVALAIILWRFRRVARRPPLLLSSVLVAIATTVIVEVHALVCITSTYSVDAIRETYADVLHAGAGLIALLLIAIEWCGNHALTNAPAALVTTARRRNDPHLVARAGTVAAARGRHKPVGL
jgi:hypothetical protein